MFGGMSGGSVDAYALERRLVRLRPGAFGLPFRGDDSLACLTSSSTRAFGTASNFRICSVKRANSGVELNEPAGFIWPYSTPLGFSLECFYRAPAALGGSHV